MEFTPLARGQYLEALHADADGSVWFSDVMEGGIRRLSPDGTQRHWLPERPMVGSLMANHDGRMLVAGPGGIVWLDPVSGASGTLVGEAEGQPLLGANEMCPDGQGGIVFGTLDLPAVLKGEKPSPAALLRLAMDGSVTRLVGGLAFCNGVGVSADGRTLFHNESFVGTFAYDLREDGSLSEKRLLADKADSDGMAMDVEGHLWVTGFASDHLLRLSPDGAQCEKIALPPGMACTSIRFGGTDGRDLYINTVPLDAAQKLVELQPLEPQGSVLFHARSTIAGRPFIAPRFTIA
jgi:sugar lactone lactonase YvrE